MSTKPSRVYTRPLRVNTLFTITARDGTVVALEVRKGERRAEPVAVITYPASAQIGCRVADPPIHVTNVPGQGWQVDYRPGKAKAT